MAVKPTSRVSKAPRRTKGGTASTRNHQFESFTQRIAKLKIDPVGKSRRHDVEQDDLKATTSHFGYALSEWSELNLSESFADFVQEVEPLCDSLAQILHYQHKIVDILVKYLEKDDVLALEPLLSLVGHLAHDINERFAENHFERMLTVITKIAAAHNDVESIEWSFECLAWLFKHLSKYLIPNLLPTYDIVAPLLGRSQQKAHIARFAAEVLSFLVRKAASKNSTALSSIIEHSLKDVQEVEEGNTKETYRYGLWSLYSDSIKGIKYGLHSTGVTIFKSLLSHELEMGSIDVVQGVLVNIIHHTTATTFAPLLEAICGSLKEQELASRPDRIFMYARLLFLISGVRKGSRVGDWNIVLDGLSQLQEATQTTTTSNDDHALMVEKTAGTIFQYAPLNFVIPYFGRSIELLSLSEPEQFLIFCLYFRHLGTERFYSLLSGQKCLQRFMLSTYESQESSVLEFLLNIMESTSTGGTKELMNRLVPAPWTEHMLKRLEAECAEESQLSMLHAYLELLGNLPKDQRTATRLLAALNQHIMACLAESDPIVTPAFKFALGGALRLFLSIQPIDKSAPLDWTQFIRLPSSFFRLPIFLQNLAQVCELYGPPTDSWTDLMGKLCNNLTSPSHQLRESSLQLLDTLTRKSTDSASDALQIALIIERTPKDTQSVRAISMHARKLPFAFRNAPSGHWTRRLIVRFLFGLLTLNLSPVWADAIAALKEICDDPEGEVWVSELAFGWLEHSPANIEDGQSGKEETLAEPQRSSTEFLCTNAEALSSRFEDKTRTIHSADSRLLQRFNVAHSLAEAVTPKARSQALKLLIGIPWIAEKRSRQLVPYLLSWNAHDEVGEVTRKNESGPESENAKTSRPTRSDKMALMEVFGAFNNPRVLYRANEVLETAQTLLASGDAGIQKLALKIIFTWKMKGVKPYQESLMNLMDDALFREELSVFVQAGQDQGVQDEHRNELMPVLLRLLYGKVTARHGTSSNKSSQTARRRAVFESLANFADEDISRFLGISLGPLDGLPLMSKEHVQVPNQKALPIGPRQQLGLTNMLQDLIDVFGHRLSFLAPKIASSILRCIANSPIPSTDATTLEEGIHMPTSLAKDIRATGLQCLNMLYARCYSPALQTLTPVVFNLIMEPRLDKLAIETAHGISGLLRLISTWTSSVSLAQNLSEYDPRLLTRVSDILKIPSAKDEVKLFVLNDILKTFVKLSQKHRPTEEADFIPSTQIQQYAEYGLHCTGILLESGPSKQVLTSAIEFVALVSAVLEGSGEVQRLLEITSFLIDQPTARVPIKVKGDLLSIMEHWIPSSTIPDKVFHQIYKSISTLFKYLEGRHVRTKLCNVLKALSEVRPSLAEVANVCQHLNAFSTQTVDTPDFDLRLKAFNKVNDILYQSFTLEQWMPIVFNFLHFIRDEEELAVRSSASYGLRRFIEASAKADVTAHADMGFQPELMNGDKMETDDEKTLMHGLTQGQHVKVSANKKDWNLTQDALLPALREGVSATSELVRAEYLAVMAQLVRHYPKWSEINDMINLLVNDDDEASFFTNVLHIQQHRRLKALRRLASEASRQNQQILQTSRSMQTLNCANVAHFFIPLLEHFIFERAEDEVANNLAGESISTIGALASNLDWPQLRAIFRRYSGYISTKPELEKSVVRLLGLLIDAIGKAAEFREAKNAPEIQLSGEDQHGVERLRSPNELSRTIPRLEKLSDDLAKNILPSLSAYLHNKDEATVSLRVPVAVSAVKLIKILPEQERMNHLPPLLTDVCHILRSRAQESRDMTRKTLVEISALVGADYFGFVLKELRAALARGYQLHVLSFTVHSILVETSEIFKPGELDYCLPQIVAVIMDDIFGVTGQEKDAEEYISKMKEVKSSKSYDSMELVSKISSVTQMAALVRPLQSLLGEKLDLRSVKKAEELLRRIGQGLLRNESVESQDTLVACYEIIQDSYKTRRLKSERLDPRTKRFLINSRGAKVGHASQSTSSFTHKLTKFAFDLLRVVVRKHESLKTSPNLAGFIQPAGDALLAAHEDVQIAALRFIAEIMSMDMTELDKNANVYVAEAVKIIKNAVSTSSEISQASLKLITSTLRERQGTTVKDTDIAYLLKKLRDDLDEPDRQGVTFNFLKAVISRRLMVPEVYETMDSVAAMMVTSQSKTTRDMARGVYFDFLLNYPHTKKRVSKQVTFLVNNLDYKHVEGRQSVMEAVHRLVTKAPSDLMQDLAGTFFVPLVLSTVNDESVECRKMAGALLQLVLDKAEDEQLRNILSLMKSWLSQDEQPLLIRASLQLYGMLVDVHKSKVAKDMRELQSRSLQLLESRLKSREAGEWELIYHTVQLLAKLVSTFPDTLLCSEMQPLWNCIDECSFFPHAWVKLAAAQLHGLRFADVGRQNKDSGNLKRPLKGQYGLVLPDEEILRLSKAFLRSLTVPGISEELGLQLARDLIFLGAFSPTKMLANSQDEDESGSSDGSEDIEEAEVTPELPSNSPLRLIFLKLSNLLRKEPHDNKAPALVSKTIALQILASLARKLPQETLQPYVQTILLPLLHLTDNAFKIPFSTDQEFTDTFKSIISSSHEVLGILQKTLGTSLYVNEVAAVQSKIKERREERRVKRRLEAVAEPDRIASQKKRKIEREKLRRKEKAAEFRGRRRGW